MDEINKLKGGTLGNVPHSFVQIPPHSGHLCLKLATTATFVARDSHPIDNAHAGRTDCRVATLLALRLCHNSKI
jgi:hypothetical protein